MNKKLLIPAAIVAALLIALLVRSQSEDEVLDGSGLGPSDSLQLQPPPPPPPPPDSARADTSARPNSPAPARPSPDTTRPAPSPVPQPQPAPAAQNAAAEALKRASSAYANVRSLRADFTQAQDNPLLGKKTTSRGTVMQRQPDRFLMRFSQPAGDVIVGDGEYFWIYYPSVDAKQVLRTRAAGAGGLDMQAQFIGDPTQRFRYTDNGVESVNGRPARAITLVPREPAGYETLKVWIDERDHLVRRFELTNQNGVVQRFDLSNLEINPQLANDLFRFTPPPNAQVIERAP